MQSLAEAVFQLSVETAWLDGELVVQGAKVLPDFNALQNAFDKGGTEDITCFVFDLLYLNGKDLRPLEYRQGDPLRGYVRGELVATACGLSQTFERWLADLDRIDHAASAPPAHQHGERGLYAARARRAGAPRDPGAARGCSAGNDRIPE